MLQARAIHLLLLFVMLMNIIPNSPFNKGQEDDVKNTLITRIAGRHRSTTTSFVFSSKKYFATLVSLHLFATLGRGLPSLLL
jgi:hypothetical protein